MATRLSRQERQAQTRSALVQAAREAFLEDGYDGASLTQIAEAAGVTTGAVYANFAGKDDLFLAVLDERSARRLTAQYRLAEADLPLDDALRRIARFLGGDEDEDPRWTALVAEYWARAARHPEFQERAARRFEAIVEDISQLVEGLARRHGMELAVPAREAARSGGALSRGIRLERAIGIPDSDHGAGYEDIFVAMMRGLLRQRGNTGEDREA